MGQEVSSPQGAQRAPKGDGIARDIEVMDDRMKAKLQRGVNYNMKVVIRGAAKTGKSQLLRRLQGRPFDASYVRTSRIQSANINWSYKETNDVVKVEVWDVVDKGFIEQSRAAAFTSRAKSLFQGARALPMTQEEMIADASTVDVYRGTHAVVFTFDITRRETFDYVKKELPNVPAHIHILLLANFYDLFPKAVVKAQEIKDLVKARNTKRQNSNEGHMYSLNTSMKDCFGLVELYSLLNIPFLSLKVKALEESVARIYEDITAYDKDFNSRADLQDYAAHLRLLGQFGGAGQVAVSADTPTAPVIQPAAVPEESSPTMPEAPMETPEYVELQDDQPKPKKKDIVVPPQTNGVAPSPLHVEHPVPTPVKSTGETSMDDFFDDVDLSEPEEEKSEESEEESGLARPLDDPGQEEAHRKASHEAAEKAKLKVKDKKPKKTRKGSKAEATSEPETTTPSPPPPPPPPPPPVVDVAVMDMEARALKLQEEVDAIGQAENRENTLDGFLSDPDDEATQATILDTAVRQPSAVVDNAGTITTQPSEEPMGRPLTSGSNDQGQEQEVEDGAKADEEDDDPEETGYAPYSNDDVGSPFLNFGTKPASKPVSASVPQVQLSPEAQMMMAQIAAQMAAEAAREEEQQRMAHEAMRRERKEKKEKKEKTEKKEKKEKVEGDGVEKKKKEKHHDKDKKEKKEKKKKEKTGLDEVNSGPVPLLEHLEDDDVAEDAD